MGINAAQWVIGLWIPFTFYLFKRYPAPRAALYAYFGGLLALPNWVAIKIPLFVPIEKENIIGIAMLLVLAFRTPAGLRRAETWWYVAFVGFVLAQIATGLTNPDPVYFVRSGTSIPGHGVKDIGYLVIGSILGPVTISYLGLRIFRTMEDLRLIVRVLSIAGLIYSIPILLEIRLSPQFHNWVYGYAGPHEWGQLVRYGGYRPLVMLTHGLVLSLFMLMPTIAATSLARSGARVWRVSGNQAAWYLTVILVLCKSTGVWLYAAICLPLIRFGSSKVLLRTALVLCLTTTIWPYLRANQVIPTTDIVEWIEKKDVERAQSLGFRFVNEDLLLARALQRPWFGWGGYGRARVYDEYGIDRCVTDGLWVMTLGSLGWVGYLLRQIFSVGALLIASRRIAKIRDSQIRNSMAALVLGCSILWFDTLPNAPDFMITDFLAAAMCGIARTVLADEAKARFKRPESAGRGGRDPTVAQAS